jgi:AhpD family alkylhydroperoxidase
MKDSSRESSGKPSLSTERRELIRKMREQLGDGELTQALVDLLIEQHGSLGFILNVLKDRPRNFNPFILKGMSIYREPSSLDRRTAELIAIGAAAALRCDHCLEAHMRRAQAEGASFGEIMDALLVAGAIAESSTLSVSFRKYRQLEGKTKRDSTDDD